MTSKMKGRFHVEYVANISIYTKRSPATLRNRLRARTLARITEFSVMPSFSATRAAGSPSTPVTGGVQRKVLKELRFFQTQAA